jgi:hypothetical protein
MIGDGDASDQNTRFRLSPPGTITGMEQNPYEAPKEVVHAMRRSHLQDTGRRIQNMHVGRLFTVDRIPLFTLVAGIGLAIGFLVPVAFEVAEEPWNRTRLISMERAAIVTVALSSVLCVCLAWLGKKSPPAAERRPKVQFRLRQLFVVITLAAILLAVMKWLNLSWASGLVTVVALGVLCWALCKDARVRSRAAALVAGLFCPLVWMVAYNVPFGRTSGLVTAMPFAPAILPASLIRIVTSGGGPDEMGVIAGVIVIAELVLGSWLAYRGGKLFVAYLLLVMVVSSISSFSMHVLYRA